eukprot:GFKZ01012870.1.p1 GENE.GFKZ01012870.1~~GFKZ01012870.1.p1  ORF type:complete len:690 (+),score=93.08 GFKZ01012870.1:322-2391(+)
MGDEYNTGGKEGHMIYDDSAFQLFLVALLAVYWIPSTIYRSYSFLRRTFHVKTPLEKAKEEWCPCTQCKGHAEHHLTKTKGHRAIGFFDVLYVVVTLLLIFCSVKVYRANLTAEPHFDPFAILEVSEGATMKEIKRSFRRLSVIHHPDKNPDDPTAGDRFIRLGKAYAALTDDVARANYVKYGNPDGYLGTTLGLGLPEWVAESHNSVLFFYFIFIVLVFPTMVGVWWRKRSQQLTSEIMTSTFMLYRETLQNTTRFRDLLAAFCGSYEFRELYNSDNDEVISELSDSLRRSGKVDMKKMKTVVSPERFQVQNFFVMSAYLARMPIPKKLEYVATEILMRCDALLTAMTDTVGAFQRPECQAAWDKTFMHGHTVYLATCISLTQCVIQALDEKSSPFMQIPHFTEREVKYCLASRTPTVRSIYDLMRLDMGEQRKILRNFTDDQFLDMKTFLDRFPSANLEVSEAIVEGEADPTVHAGDSVTVRAKLTIMRRSGSAFSPCTPYLPYRKEEAWWVWIADERLMCPIKVRRLLPHMAIGHDAGSRRKAGRGGSCCGVNDDDEQEVEHQEKLTSDPRVTIFNMKFTFTAPRAGDYNLEVKTACDCYKGASKSKVIKMKVLKAVEPPEDSGVKYFDTDDESSEEEEESTEAEDEEDDSEYEYIEVSEEESEAGDFDDDDQFGVSSGPTGNPAG